jgi:hippurate hydrolase
MLSEDSEFTRETRRTWARLLAKIFAVNAMLCSCGAEMKIISTITEPRVVNRILRHLESERCITNGIAAAAGVPAERAPIIEVARDSVPATINDPVLTQRIAGAMEKSLGKENVRQGLPIMASGDFSLFALREPKPPISMFWLGAVDPAIWKDAQERGTRLPSLHSGEFAPLPEPAIRAGVKAMTAAAMDLLRK